MAAGKREEMCKDGVSESRERGLYADTFNRQSRQDTRQPGSQSARHSMAHSSNSLIVIPLSIYVCVVAVCALCVLCCMVLCCVVRVASADVDADASTCDVLRCSELEALCTHIEIEVAGFATNDV